MICQREGLTRWEDEADRSEAVIAPDEAALVAFCGYGRLAKRLYQAAGIDAAQRVD